MKLISNSRSKSYILCISLKYKLFMIFAVIGIVPLLVVGLLSYHQSQKSIYNNIVLYSKSIIKQVADNFDRFLGEFEYTTLELVNSREVQEGLLNHEDDYLIEQKYKMKFVFYSIQRHEIVDIAIYRENDRMDSLKATLLIESLKMDVLKGSEAVGEDFYQRVIGEMGGVLWVSDKIYKSNEIYFDNNITMARKVKDFNNGKDLGIFIMHINREHIKNVYEDVDLGEEGHIVICDEEFKIVSHADDEKLGRTVDNNIIKNMNNKKEGSFKEFVNGQDCFVSFTSSSVTGWKIMSIVPMKTLMKDINMTKNIIIIIGLVIIVLIIIFSIIFSGHIFRPINHLRKQMKVVEKGNMDIEMCGFTRDEIGDLTEGFYNMVGKINNLMIMEKEKQKKMRIVELKALQSQINPHFLYNTIDTALWFAKEIKAEEIEEILLALANFYRISLSKGNNLVKIADELDHVKNYLAIENIRYEGKFDVEFDVESDILDKMIVKITLQPLVENAIKHGIRKRPGKGHIKISGKCEGDKIILEISDDGVGMIESELRSVLKGNANSDIYASGYGVHNVHERLVLQYGKEYGLKFKSVKRKGTCVTIIIPYES